MPEDPIRDCAIDLATKLKSTILAVGFDERWTPEERVQIMILTASFLYDGALVSSIEAGEFSRCFALGVHDGTIDGTVNELRHLVGARRVMAH